MLLSHKLKIDTFHPFQYEYRETYCIFYRQQTLIEESDNIDGDTTTLSTGEIG